VQFIIEQTTVPDYNADLENLPDAAVENYVAGDDDLFLSAVTIVVESQKASTSLLQRKLKLGYSRAARLMDMMEEQGIVSALDSSNKRKVLYSKERGQELAAGGEAAVDE
jgi:S-DNA-T family DNA segregation ATPase FtsK/SpoIIIE